MTDALTTVASGALAERRVDDQPVWTAYQEIQSLLRTRLSGEHAQLFAEPRPAADGINWFPGRDGSAIPVVKLSLQERTRAMRRVDQLLADVRTMADRIGPESANLRKLAKILKAVAQRPPPQWVWTIDGKVVMAGWAHEPPAIFAPVAGAASAVMATADGSKAVRGTVSGPPPARPMSSTQPTIVKLRADASRGTGLPLFFGLLLPLLLILGFGWILFRPISLLPHPDQDARLAAMRQMLVQSPDAADCAPAQKP